MKKFISILLSFALIVGLFSSMTIIAEADNALILHEALDVSGKEEGGFSKWLSFTPEEDGRYSFEISFDIMAYWGYTEAILCDSSKDMIDADINFTPTQMCYVEADLKGGEQYFLQVYGEDVGEFTVTANKILKITKLEIEKYPDKLTYYEGAEIMDISGLTVKAIFEDGSTESYTSTEYWSEIGPGGNFIAVMNEEHPITGDWSEYQVVCGGHTVAFSFTRLESPVESITVNAEPDVVYYYGDEAFGSLYPDGYEFYPGDLSGLNFTVNFKDGSSKTYSSADFNDLGDMIDGEYFSYWSDFEDVIVGLTPVQANYMGYNFTFNVKMESSPISEINVIKNPNVTEFEEEFEPDFTGMSIELVYNDGHKNTVQVTKENIYYGFRNACIYDESLETIIFLNYIESFENLSISYAGTYITYNKLFTTDKIQIEDIELDNVSLDPSTMSIKLNYVQGYSETLTVNKTDIIDAYDDPEHNIAYTWCKLYTNKGVIDCDIWGHYENGAITSYEVAMLGFDMYIEENLLGDVNGDTNINAADALLVLKHAAKISELTNEETARGDVTKDNQLNAADALDILKYAAHIIDSFN